MSTSPQQKEAISFKDLFTLHFLRALFKSVWLFFPAILFLLLALEAFWQLSQGQDLLERTLENGRIFALFIIAEVFWTYITWYTCYIISKIKLAALPTHTSDEDIIHWRRMLTQMPRFLAFTCLTIIILAFFKLATGEKYNWLFFIILAISPSVYAFIYNFWSRLADKVDDEARFPSVESKIKYLNKYRHTTLAMLAVSLIAISFFHTPVFLMVLLMIFQLGLVLLLVFKKKRFVVGYPVSINDEPQNTLAAKVKKHIFGSEEKSYTRLFFIALFFGLIFYISTIASISVSVMIGAVPFILFAFGILLILGNGVTFLSVIYRINLHGIAMIIAFIFPVLINFPVNLNEVGSTVAEEISLRYRYFIFETKKNSPVIPDWEESGTAEANIDNLTYQFTYEMKKFPEFPDERHFYVKLVGNKTEMIWHSSAELGVG